MDSYALNQKTDSRCASAILFTYEFRVMVIEKHLQNEEKV